MDYVDDGLGLSLTFFGLLAVVVCIGFLIHIITTKKTLLNVISVIIIEIMMGSIAAITLSTASNIPTPSMAYKQDIESLYGLNASGTNIKELGFPKRKPNDEPAFYGRTTLLEEDSSETKMVEVILGWDGEQFLLYSVGDEQTATPLPFKDEQQT